ncbi:MAG TPA: 1,4-alpha-glucan branching protein GlgB, partial [Bacillota bacterium]|nr:1,4-alpha-glucan branching protein GlgB [Bacillota bacterium]
MSAEGQAIAAVEQETEFLTNFDLHLFHEGTHFRLYEKLGAHPRVVGGVAGVHFGVWAPNAQAVSVIGDFNSWDPAAHPLSQCNSSGVWAGFIPLVNAGAAYRYHILSWHQGYQTDKTDPMAFRRDPPPGANGYVWDLHYEWGDQEWMLGRAQHNRLDGPLAIYEVHLGSWMRVPEEGNRPLTYRELAPKLAEYVQRLGFTHVELLPVMEHRLEKAWSHQICGYFAASSRYGAPQDLMYLIDYLHQHQIGVILDWVPAHFPIEKEGPAYFDGTHLYEQNYWQIDLPEDGVGYGFDYSRPEVRSFLLSSALFWLDKYHADGLRLDEVAAMLHLDYGRKPGEWIPNNYGGRENLEGIDFLRQFNVEVYREFPDVQTIAEEATAWPRVSHPTYAGGLGFGFKWDQSFTHHTLQYFSHDPFFRKFHHELLTGRGRYQFSENFVLPLSHEEVMKGRPSLLARMAGDEWQRFANLRLLLSYQYLQPGKKLLCMGDEFAQWLGWNAEASLDWHLTAYPLHSGMQRLVTELNHLYRQESALHQSDTMPTGFESVDGNDAEHSTLSWLRRDAQRRAVLLVLCNFTPEVRRNFRVGVRRPGLWREVLNSDAKEYGGSG